VVGKGHRSPVWPPVRGEQRPRVHFGFQVGDLESATEEAVAPEATIAEHQSQGNAPVVLYPTMH
jgi:hypothetical protein